MPKFFKNLFIPWMSGIGGEAVAQTEGVPS